MSTSSVAVIGGGMAGLSAAHYLNAVGLKTTIFESEPEVGGRTRSKLVDGYNLDLGAITLAPAYQNTLRLINDVGIGDSLKPLSPILGIVRQGRVCEIDLAKPIRSGLSMQALSLKAKIKLLRLIPYMLRYRSRCNFYGMADLEELDNETCRDFTLRVLGDEAHDYLVDPMIRVNMFSTTSVSSVVDFIWLLTMFSTTEIVQLAGGMGSLARAIAANLDIQVNAAVNRVEIEGNDVWVRLATGDSKRFDGVVIATPPPVARALVPWLSGPHQSWFAKVQPVKSLTVHVGLSRRPSSRASIIMVPTRVQKDVLGVVLEHNKCPERAPQGKGLVAIHMTQAWAETQSGLDDRSVAANAYACVKQFLGDDGGEIEMVNLHCWDYVDHERYVGSYKALAEAVTATRRSRVVFAGEYISAGIEGAVISGEKSATALAKTLAKQH